MLAYRIFVASPGAARGKAGHPEYLPVRQGGGRWDNADAYRITYLAADPEGAVGEVFGDLPVWTAGMFTAPYLPDGRRSLAIFEVPDTLDILDLDDAGTLVDQKLRPTQVVIRNPAFTQAFALSAFRQRGPAGVPRWHGIRWWSFHRPQWPLLAIWVPPGESSPLRLVAVEPLSLDSVAVRDAATALSRPIR